jgi:molybdenum cofactor cytidylyltransferase
MRNIGAVVLAAGGSSRLGQPKQLLVFRGETLVRRAVRAATEAGCAPILVVVGEIGEAIKRSVDIRDSRISSSSLQADQHWSATDKEGVTGPAVVPTVVQNADWREGIGTSIRRGLELLPKDVHAAVLLTCDQPFLDVSIVRQLIVAQEETGKPIVASSYANTLGIPALFHRSCFDALLALPDDAGSKAFILSRRGEVASIPFPRGEIDIDTPEDLKRLTTL